MGLANLKINRNKTMVALNDLSYFAENYSLKGKNLITNGSSYTIVLHLIKLTNHLYNTK